MNIAAAFVKGNEENFVSENSDEIGDFFRVW